MTRIPEVDNYITKTELWQDELSALRDILLANGLKEEYKWRNPVYTLDGKNIALLGRFKKLCCIGFFKGSLMQDDAKILVQPGENTQSSRNFEIRSIQELEMNEELIGLYIQDAIRVEKAGLKVAYTPVTEMDIPIELQEALDDDPEFKHAYEGLTPGRQKGYILYFSAAKQSATRVKRIMAYYDRILSGKGFHDCVCGLSKKMPNCDGSHRELEKK